MNAPAADQLKALHPLLEEALEARLRGATADPQRLAELLGDLGALTRLVRELPEPSSASERGRRLQRLWALALDLEASAAP